MTQQDAKKLLESGIIQALAEGKTIQYYCGGDWVDVGNPMLDGIGHYRVKPEPREFWVNLYPNDAAHSAHRSKERADERATPNRIECLHVREVV